MKKIPVTKTFLPPQEEYQRLLKRVWDKGWITNRGDLILELEKKLKTFLNSPNLIITNNGTISLQLAIKTLDLKGEIITTPFSYIASASSIVWENCKPIFVDIDKEYLTINEAQLESAITSNTVAILAVHVYGNPCNVEEIQRIADKYSLKVIYDAAHAFGVNYKEQSIFDFGDISTCSFHATKLFHTGEGGAIFIKNTKLYNKTFYHHNFGHDGSEKFHGLGINGKLSELQAAMGLSVFPYIDDIIKKRREIYNTYVHLLCKNPSILFQKIREDVDYNFAYFPVIFSSEEQLLKVKEGLQRNEIFPRRYFYPSLNTIDYLKGQRMPVSESIASRVLCLPLYVGLELSDVKRIVTLINNSQC